MHIQVVLLSTIATLSSVVATAHHVPECAKTCLTGVWATSSCSSPDLPCLCHASVGLLDRMAPCAVKACSDDAAFGVAMKFAYSLCANPAEKHDVLKKRTFEHFWPEKKLPIFGNEVEDACNKCAAGHKLLSPVSGTATPTENYPQDNTTTTTSISGYGEPTGDDYGNSTTYTSPAPTTEPNDDSDLSGNQPEAPVDSSTDEPDTPVAPVETAVDEPSAPVEPVDLSGGEPGDLSDNALSAGELSDGSASPDYPLPRLPKSEISGATQTSMAFALGLLGLMICMA